MANNKSNAERERERQHRLELLKFSEGFKTARYLGLLILVGFGLWLGTKSVAVLAGKQTAASFGFSLISNLSFEHAACLTITMGSVGYGGLQRWLRKRAIKRLGERAARWEQSIDAGRTSSKLTGTGDTNPTDR